MAARNFARPLAPRNLHPSRSDSGLRDPTRQWSSPPGSYVFPLAASVKLANHESALNFATYPDQSQPDTVVKHLPHLFAGMDRNSSEFLVAIRLGLDETAATVDACIMGHTLPRVSSLLECQAMDGGKKDKK